MAEPAADGTRPPSSYDAAGYWSRFTYGYVGPLLARGEAAPLRPETLEELPEHDRAERLVARLERAWAAERRSSPRPSLARALVAANAFEFWYAGYYSLLESVFRVLQPVVLREFAQWLGDAEAGEGAGWTLAALLGAGALGQVVAHHRLYFYTMRGGYNARAACSGAVFNKTLRLSTAAIGDVGKVVTLASSDSLRFDNFFPALWFGVTAPLDVAACVVLLGLYLDWPSALAGAGTLMLLLPVQARFARLFTAIRGRTARLTDRRVGLVGGLLAGIATIKAAVWEGPFSRLVEQARVRERASIARSQRLKAFNASLYFVSPALAALATFAVFWARDNELTVVDVFTTAALLSVLRTSFARHWTRFVEAGSECAVAVGRMQRFLEIPELGPESTPDPLERARAEKRLREHGDDGGAVELAGGGGVELEAASFAWPGGAPALSALTLSVRPGELVMVTGPVGAGKSALLLGLLGELQLTGGAAVLRGSCGYCGQQAWIRSGTVRENVLFGLPFDEARWRRAIDAACMAQDLRELPRGADTLIGDRGVNLSGGQRARVSLARAVYADADVYLLDDPLSAVDPHVGLHLFERCLRGALRDKAVLLASHQVQFIMRADRVLVLGAGGQVVAAGPPRGLAAAEALAGQAASFSRDDAAEEGGAEEAGEAEAHDQEQDQDPDKDEQSKKATKLVADEERRTGHVGWQSYKRYMQAGGAWGAAGCAALFVLSQGAVVGSDLWLKHWAEQPAAEQRDAAYLHWFVGAVAATVALCVARSWGFFAVCLRAATTLHARMFGAVLASPFSFFTANPLGRVLNKFSGDQAIVDEVLPVAMIDGIVAFAQTVASAVLICVAVPLALLPLLPIAAGCVYVTRRYLASSRELKRLEAVSRSPIYSELGETIHGLTTVRACRGGAARARSAFLARLDANGRAWFSFLLVSRWLGTRLDLLVGLLVAASTLLSAALKVRSPEDTDVGLVAMAIQYGIALSGIFQWAIRRGAEVESLMTAVERQLHYTALPPEGAASTQTPDDLGWPRRGAVEFQDVSVRWREDMPLVLRNVSFAVEGGQKVGVVGRTGSGKSSLIQSLFRLNSVVGGRVLVDGVDAALLQLPVLRRALALIPQDPFLFQGSLRFNLDPFDEHPDADLVEVLRAVELGHLADDLQQSVSGGSDLLSVGQRQLLSMARAALRRSRILVLDEATANVDYRTDALIQRALREHPAFKGCTSIIIAHRVKTVLDADQILVLADGRLVESGPPAELREIEGGVFRGMVLSSRDRRGE